MWQKILERLLLRFYGQKTVLFLERWHRSLPLSEMIVDRWEKARMLGFGEGANIYDTSLVLGDVHVGKNTWIGPFTILDGSGGRLTIGDYCSISAGVQIYTHDSVKWALSCGNEKLEKAPVTIGNGVYVGPSTVITKGSKIGSQCVIGALSYVDKEIPDFSVAVGTTSTLFRCIVIGEKRATSFEAIA